jgi:hypothetical protein
MLHSADFPRISFGIIVLNGGPFTKYCLRQLYPHAYEIIVVEGGSKKAIDQAPEGHSTDGTLEALSEFKAQEDPENKVRIITRDGFWTEKDEQSQAYAQVATGDYLWQVDIDEFYTHSDLHTMRRLLAEHPEVDTVSFRAITFWGHIKYCANSLYMMITEAKQWHRLFRWRPGYRYITHRPSTVVDEDGRDLRTKVWWTSKTTDAFGIRLYHYSLLFPKQVMEKFSYGSKLGPDGMTGGYLRDGLRWVNDYYLKLGNPFKVHNASFGSNFYWRNTCWLYQYYGEQPEEICQMWHAIQNREIICTVRDCADVEDLLQNRCYTMAARLLTALGNNSVLGEVYHSGIVARQIVVRVLRFLFHQLKFGSYQQRHY